MKQELSAITFVHGDFGNGESSFGKVAAELPAGSQLLLLDRPGFSPDVPQRERYTFAEDAATLLEETRRQQRNAEAPFHLVGHSYGGVVAMEMARQRPDLILSLHLIEPPLLQLLPEDNDVIWMDRQVRSLQAAHQDDDLSATTAAFFSMIGAGHVVERLRDSEEWTELARYAARFARNEPPGNYPLERFRQIDARIPIALYSGGRSHAALRRIAQTLAQDPRVVAFTDLPEAGHAVQMAGERFWRPMLAVMWRAEVDAAPQAASDPIVAAERE